MTSEQDWKRIQVVFERAIELPNKERKEYLDEVCDGDESMRGEVESLLESFQPSSELEDSPLNWDSTDISTPTDSISGYQILHELHRGGQGVVYLALQESTKRKVALKVLLQGPFAGPSSKRRFEREIELVGSLRHPGIVAIFDSGIAHGQYYYAMEYICGQRLDAFVRNQELDTRQILAVMSNVCHAVGYAHLRGVIHRDLKPANVIVDDSGEPHVLDFGLAKTGVDQGVSGLVSVSGQIMGTLAYMSPEQASGSADQIDMRSDVYALGVVLHELLSGQLPYNLDSSMANNLATIQQAEPRPLNWWNHRISDEVATIVSKSLAKDPSRRYPTASALAEDLDRYLKCEPIEAKRENSLYILQKTLRRHLIPTLIATSFATLILVSSIVAWSLYWKSEAASRAFRLERDKAEQRGEELRRSLYFAQMNLAGQASNEPGGIDRVEELIQRWPFDAEQPDLYGWEWFYMRSLPNRERFLLPQDQLVWSIAAHPSGNQLVTGGAGGIVNLWTLNEKPTVHQLKTAGLPIRSVDWSPHGRWIAAGSTDRTVIVWDAETLEVRHEWKHSSPVLSVAFHPHKPWLASAGNGGGVNLWNVDSGELIQQIDHDGVINSAQWSPDGRRLALGGRESGAIHLCDLVIGPENSVTEQRRFHVNGHNRGVFALRWSPEGDRIASCDEGGTTKIWDASQDASLPALSSNEWSSQVWNLSWHPRGQGLLVVSEDGASRILDATTGKVHQDFLGHTNAVWGCCWSRDGDWVATGGHDGTVRVWNPQGRFRNIITYDDRLGGFTSIDWSPDGTEILTCGNRQQVVLRDATSGEELGEFEEHTEGVRYVEWSPDGSRFISTSWDKTVIIWDRASGKKVNQFFWHLETAKDSVAPVHCARWSPNGKYIVSCGHATSAVVWDVDSLEVLARLDKVAPIVNDLVWDPSGEWVVIAGNDRKIQIWNPWTGRTRAPLAAHQGRIRSVHISPNGNRLASASADGTVIIWDFHTGNVIHTLKDHVAGVLCVRWHPNGKQLATTSYDNTLRIWDAQHGVQTLMIKAHSDRVDGLAWSPHGKRLATASEDGSLRIFDARLGYERSEIAD